MKRYSEAVLNGHPDKFCDLIADGKDLSHIDRLGAIATRKYALELVNLGSTEAIVKVCYAPGVNEPFDINIKSNVKLHIDTYQFFNFNEAHKLIDCNDLNYDLIGLGTFYNTKLSFNNTNN